MGKSRILIVGVTGNLGFHLAKASLQASHPTFALVRDSAFSHPEKSLKLQTLSNAGATLLKGSLQDEENLLEAIKQVDVVICAVAAKQALDQKLLVRAIKQAGCIKVQRSLLVFEFWVRKVLAKGLKGTSGRGARVIKCWNHVCEGNHPPHWRFIPSEFGLDPDKIQISGMDYNFYSRKAEIRRLVEDEGIPYTYVSCNFYMSYLLPSLVQPGLKTPPRDKVTVFGDGNVKGVFVKENDVATFTISAVDDPRTLNKVLYMRPPGNVYSMNELVEIWESKISKKLEKIYVQEEELLKKIKETPYPDNMEMIFIYSAFIKGDQTYFDIETSGGVDGTRLYPQLKYTTISQYLDTLL